MFPIIRTIDDVLPHIEGHEDFFVADRDGYKVINYRSMLAFGDLWIDNGDYPPILNTTEAMRRECRGIKFYSNGDIMARPFHKFFNANEKIENNVANLPWSKPHALLKKWDGSMVHLGYAGGRFCLMTKMGPTEVAQRAETETKFANYRKWLEYELDLGRTHIFEFVSPNNKIVVNYSEPRLIWIGARDNITGEYYDVEDFRTKFDLLEIPYEASSYGTAKDGETLLRMVRGWEGEEGVVVAWEDGRRVKIKSEWYSLLHKKKEIISNPKDCLTLILNDQTDDLIPILDEQDKSYLLKIHESLDQFLRRGSQAVFAAVHEGIKRDYSKRDFAVEIVGNTLWEHPVLRSVAFTTWDQATQEEKNVHPPLIAVWANYNLQDALKKYTVSNAKAKTLEPVLGKLSVAMFDDASTEL